MEDLKKAHNTGTTPLNPEGFKWIGLTSIDYKDPNGTDRKWEMAERLHRSASGVDGVAIYARLTSFHKPTQVVLVAQFRPPAGKVRSTHTRHTFPFLRPSPTGLSIALDFS